MRGIVRRGVRHALLFALIGLFALLVAPPAEAVGVGLDVKGAVVAAHYVQSGWDHPEFVISEMVLGPAHVGGFYVGGIGLRQVDGFGTVYPLVSYVGQGLVPKLKFLKGWTVTFAMCNEGLFSGKPAYFFGVGVAIGK